MHFLGKNRLFYAQCLKKLEPLIKKKKISFPKSTFPVLCSYVVGIMPGASHLDRESYQMRPKEDAESNEQVGME